MNDFDIDNEYFDLLGPKKNLNLCKFLAQYVKDKSRLESHILTYMYDVEWIKLMIQLFPSYSQETMTETCLKNAWFDGLKYLVSINEHFIYMNNYCIPRYASIYGNIELLKYFMSLINSQDDKRKCLIECKNMITHTVGSCWNTDTIERREEIRRWSWKQY